MEENLNKISVAIPTYEASGFGAQYLSRNLEILSKQSFKNFDVVISDNSENSDIEKVADNYKQKLAIKFFKNANRGMSVNLNNCLKKCTGQFIKIVFLDDFLFHENALMDISDNLDESTFWLITACEHTKDGSTFYRPFYPRYNHMIHLGNNTISSPSVLTIKNFDDKLFFDENLTWLMDVDYYKRCYIKFGNPKILNKINVVNTTSPTQTSSVITKDQIKKEFIYSKEKFE